ncbi:MAG: hypothetical protein OEV91_11690 [Desulfobulbaceae bacterium]|nr:hypothetical protein [Desulfobulbaceae bacterium]
MMNSLKKFLTWRTGFAVCCLLYLPWVVVLGRNNFAMVHIDYRRADERLQPAHIAAVAHRELVEECRREAEAGREWGGAGEEGCLSLPPTVVDARQREVLERLVHEQRLALRKVAFFYVSFGLFFLILPPACLYLLFFLSSWLLGNIKVVR